ncbi:YHS domain-containing (seleno)protein [Biformimicrobium ophioploci]|uniref:YHS domain protein n=1 Tax=Biformimicrobium ophioploci TaxID=3036711 RepID=A0ABQ6LVY4_9GAMM|nr:YHS domain-containing (seleno)protein [Microbulbifer sp. NKW57]GMG86187.1 hypothetical protein MNKW57_05080 [Microbulbifer sp. NKW57]
MFQRTAIAVLLLIACQSTLANDANAVTDSGETVAIPADANVYSHLFRDALKGADVVAYYSLKPGEKSVKGSSKITYDWADVTWRFASEENRDLFAADPEKFVPAYGGHCAYAMSRGFEAPPRPDSWKIVDDRLYLNNNDKSLEIWERDMVGNIEEADQNWVEMNSAD